MQDLLQAEPEVRRRYEEARKARLRVKERRLRIVSKAADQEVS